MNAPDKIYAWQSSTKPQGVNLAGGKADDQIEYTRSDLIQPASADMSGIDRAMLQSMAASFRGALEFSFTRHDMAELMDRCATLSTPATEPQGYVEALDSRTWWMLFILSKSGNQANASDERWDWINAFCEDRGNGDDTYNLAADAGLISVSHNTDTDQSTAYLTDDGKAVLAARPASADTRTVTVAQLEAWIGAMEDWDEGDAAQKIDEIRAIIGDTK